jgi:hypothetical protein
VRLGTPDDRAWLRLLVDQLDERCRLTDETITAALYGYVRRRRARAMGESARAGLIAAQTAWLDVYLLRARRADALIALPPHRALLTAAVYVVTDMAVPMRRWRLEAGELSELVDLLQLNREDAGA